MTSLFLTMASFFMIIKLLFSFIGWYVSDSGDLYMRRNLDNLFDKVSNTKISDVTYLTLIRLITKTKAYFKHSDFSKIKILIILYIINLLSVIVGLPISKALGNEKYTFLESVRYFLFQSNVNHQNIFSLIMILPIFCVIFDVLSILVTWYLLDRAVKSKTKLLTLLHIVAEIIIAVISVYCMYITIASILIYWGNFEFSFFQVIKAEWNSGIENGLLNIIVSGEYKTVSLFIIIVTVSATLSTFVYLILLIAALCCHFCPKYLYSFFIKCLYLLSVDEKPIFSRLGTFFGSASAIIVAAIKICHR